MNDPRPWDDPVARPHTYPGQPATSDCLATHDTVLPLLTQDEPWHVLQGGPSQLDTAMHRLARAAPMSARRPVLAVGSNASIGQLRRKWHDDPDMAIPLTRTRVQGIGVGYSAHVAAAGYVPYAPFAAEVGRQFMTLWLTQDQMRRLDDTEPNYVRTLLSGREYPAALTFGHELGEYFVYRGKWGLLSDGGQILPDQRQQNALDRLAQLGATADHAQLAGDARLRTAAREAMAEHSMPDGLTSPQD